MKVGVTLKSQKKFSPNSGTALYSMVIKVKIPEGMAKDELDRKLDDLAEDLNVDITIK